MRSTIARNIQAASLGIAVLSGAGLANAHDGFYVGPSVTGYYLDSDRVFKGHNDSIVGGINLGYRFTDSWAIEVGGGTDVAGDDMDVYKADVLYWFGSHDQSWRPYAVLGVAKYEIDDENLTFVTPCSGLLCGVAGSPIVTRSNDDPTQVALGVGLSTDLGDHWEFRSDLRALSDVDNNSHIDGALNVAVNYYFNAPPPPPPPVETPVAPAPAPPPPPPAPAPEPESRTISIRLNVEFEFDKAIVRAIYGDELKAIADAMKAHDDIDLVLEGHTDSVGTDQYNQDLSERRAAAVKAKLVEMYDLEPTRITTIGYGESKPIADNDTDEGRARNRRVIGELSFTEVAPD